METPEKTLNHFLVDVFHKIWKAEEKFLAKLGKQDVSVKELHVIEVVCEAEAAEGDNRLTSLANVLQVTPGTLSISVSLLAKKGYLLKERSQEDKRVVRISPTELGRKANEEHRLFHDEIIREILSFLPQKDLAVFVHALKEISTFFSERLFQQNSGALGMA